MRMQNLAVGMIALLLVGCGGAAARKTGYLTKGREYLAAHDYANARLEFRSAVQLDPNDAEASYLAGLTAEKLGVIREAAQMYQEAIQSNPKHLGARAHLGLLYAVSGTPEKTSELVEPGLAIKPDDPELLTARGAARQRLGDTAGARADAEKAVAGAPADETAVSLLASLYNQAGETPRAIDLVNKAAGSPGASPDLRVVLARLYLGAGNRAAAVHELELAVAAEPDKLAHRYQLAQALLLDKNVDGAEAALRGAIAQSPKSAEAKLALANMLASNRSFDVAEKELKSLCASAPDDYQLRLGLGQFYTAHGKPAEAEAVYRKIIDDDGTNANGLTARNRLIDLDLTAHRLDEASTLIDEVLKKNPRDNDALFARANVSLSRGKADAAITDLRAVQRDQPNSIPLTRALVRAYQQNDDPTLAEETLRTALKNSPTNVDLRLDLAQLELRTGQRSAALPLLQKLADEQPANVAVLDALFAAQLEGKDFVGARRTAGLVQVAKPDQPNGFYMSGVAELADGKPDAARAAFEHALLIAPAAVEPFEALVRLDLRQQHPEQAIARLDKVISQFPKNPLPHDLKGDVLAGLKRTEPAIASYREALALNPTWAKPYAAIAAAQVAAGRDDAAIAALQEGLKATHDAPQLVPDLAGLYERLGKVDEAVALYDAMLKRDPDSAIAANNLAMLLVTHRTDRASLDRARTLTERFASSRNPALLDTRGWVLYKGGDVADALDALQKSVDKAPREPEILYHLAMAQLKSGARDSARSSLKLALDGNYAFLDRDAAQQTLATL